VDLLFQLVKLGPPTAQLAAAQAVARGRLTLVKFFWFWGRHTVWHHITWLSVILDSHWLAHQVTGRRAPRRNTALRLAWSDHDTSGHALDAWSWSRQIWIEVTHQCV